MKTRLLLFFFCINLSFSCDKFSKQDRPTLDETKNYLSDKINGNDLYGTEFSVIDPKIVFNGNQVIYTYENKFKNSEDHYKLKHTFSLDDIKYTSDGSFGQLSYITLELKDGSNIQYVESLNHLPLPDYAPPIEYRYNLNIYLKEADYEGIKKAFNTILEIKRDNLKTDYFEN